MRDGKRSVGWRLPVLLALVLVGIIAGRGWLLPEISSSSQPAAGTGNSILPTGDVVSLVLEFGEGDSRQFGNVPYRPGMTVRDLLESAGRRDPSLQFTQRGTGTTAMLIKLGGVQNQGGDGRNWMYWVNGELAKVSFDVYELQPGDRVLWKFAENE